VRELSHLLARNKSSSPEIERSIRAIGLKRDAVIHGVPFTKPTHPASMIRDCAITALLQRRLSTKASMTRDAATVLLGLCGAGMSDAEIAMALANSARLRSAELTSEILILAREVGLAL
jgi:hypothetical protein